MKTPRHASFQELRIWQEAHALMVICHGIANILPNNERERMSQIKRSSSSVPDNIAEGYGSYYYNDKLKGFYTARKELSETENHILSLASKKFISDIRAQELVDRYEGLKIGMNKFIRYIITKRDR